MKSFRKDICFVNFLFPFPDGKMNECYHSVCFPIFCSYISFSLAFDYQPKFIYSGSTYECMYYIIEILLFFKQLLLTWISRWTKTWNSALFLQAAGPQLHDTYAVVETWPQGTQGFPSTWLNCSHNTKPQPVAGRS